MRSPMGSFSIAMSDMSDADHSVIVDMIMVQVISLALGAFLIIAFGAYRLSPQELTWMLIALFVSFSMVGAVYRSLARSV